MKIFKRIFAAAVTAALALGTMAALPASAEETAAYQMGDANMDGRVDIYDAQFMLIDYTLTMIGRDPFLSEEAYAFADLDGYTCVHSFGGEEIRSRVTVYEAYAVLMYYTYAEILHFNDYTLDDAVAKYVLPMLENFPERYVRS